MATDSPFGSGDHSCRFRRAPPRMGKVPRQFPLSARFDLTVAQNHAANEDPDKHERRAQNGGNERIGHGRLLVILHCALRAPGGGRSMPNAGIDDVSGRSAIALQHASTIA